MKKWTKKIKELSLKEQYILEIKKADDFQNLTLDHAIDSVHIWSYLCSTFPDKEDLLSTAERYIKMEVQYRWGRCTFFVDRLSQEFTAHTFDGRAMNLSTGDLID